MSDPKEAPVGNWKCLPMVGVSGDVIVNPSKLSVVAVRIARMDMVVFLDMVFVVPVVDDDGCFVSFSLGEEEEEETDAWS